MKPPNEEACAGDTRTKSTVNGTTQNSFLFCYRIALDDASERERTPDTRSRGLFRASRLKRLSRRHQLKALALDHDEEAAEIARNDLRREFPRRPNQRRFHGCQEKLSPTTIVKVKEQPPS
jgi:hypothetical protein